MIIIIIILLLFCNGTCCCCMKSKPVYFKIEMWICCITVHIVIDQIFDIGLLFFPFFMWILLQGAVCWKTEYYSHDYGKKCMKFDFVLNLLVVVFASGGILNISDSEKIFFSIGRRSVAGLLEECYRMCFCWMLKR